MQVLQELALVTLPQFQIYALVLVRVTFIFVIAPIFGSRTIPVTVKAALVAVVALAAYPSARVSVDVRSLESVWSLLPALAGEAAVGLMIGGAARFIFYSVELGGFIAGFQMGFLVASAIDPQEGRNSPLIAQFQEMLALLLFLALDGHHWVLRGLASSYQLVPAFGAKFSGLGAGVFLEFVGEIFLIALKLSAPVVIALLMTSVSMGILGRTVPQMNVFVVSFPLTIGVGFLAMALSFQIMGSVLEGKFLGIGDDIVRLLAGFR